MNKLSWMLYAADALDKLSTGLLIVGGLCGAGAVFGWAFVSFLHTLEERPRPTMPKPIILACLAALFAGCLLPSSRTVYMIAASEAGEKIVATAEAREMLDLVRQKLKTVLTDKT